MMIQFNKKETFWRKYAVGLNKTLDFMLAGCKWQTEVQKSSYCLDSVKNVCQ